LDAEDDGLFASEEDCARDGRIDPRVERHLRERSHRCRREEINVAFEIVCLDREFEIALPRAEGVEMARLSRVANVERRDASTDLVRRNGRRRIGRVRLRGADVRQRKQRADEHEAHARHDSKLIG
jgi:hypothetical protein